MSQPNDPRPILVGGERLILDVDQVNSGGGDKYHPMTAKAAASMLAPMVTELTDRFSQLPQEALGTARYFQTTLLPNYLAASHFPAQLLAAAGLVAVGSRAAPGTYETATKSEPTTTKSLIVAGPSEGAARLSDIIESAGTGGKSQRNAFEQLREISEIRMANNTEVLGTTPHDADVWEAVLNPLGIDQSGDLVATDDETFEKWISWIANLGGQVVDSYRRTEAGLTFVPVRMDAEGVHQASQFNPLRSLRPMPVLRPLPTTFLRVTPPTVLPPEETAPEGTHTIAVFDGGLQKNSLLDSIAVTDVTNEPENHDATSHGTAVTGSAIYGLLTPGKKAQRPASAAEHYRVFPGPPGDKDVYVYWVLDQIEAVLTTTHYPIVNLSIGVDVSVEDDGEPNRWTSTLDRIAYEHDVLFVVAAGNNGAEDEQTGLNRVQSPADMANGVSVGACDEPHSKGWERTWYSAVGPGRNGSRIQPNGVQFGGNLTADRPFYGLHANLQLRETQGTSFSGPITTNALSRLGAILGSEWKSANTLRAFATHFAERHPGEDVRVETGHGRFALDYASELQCAANEVHLLYQSKLYRHELLSFRLPVPRSIVSGSVKLRLTMAFASPVEPTQPLEYTQATIEPVFRPHTNKFRFSKDKKSKTVNVGTEPEIATKLIADGYVISGHPVSRVLPGTSGSEIELREGGKWETVRRIDLPMQATSLLDPRLDLSYVSRKSGLLQSSAAPLDFTLLASVIAPKIDTLYSDVEAAYPILSRLDVANEPQITTTISN